MKEEIGVGSGEKREAVNSSTGVVQLISPSTLVFDIIFADSFLCLFTGTLQTWKEEGGQYADYGYDH